MQHYHFSSRWIKSSCCPRVGDLKLIRGDAGKPDGWIPPSDVLGLEGEDLERAHKLFFSPSPYSEGLCGGQLKMRLFNLTADPNEKRDLSGERPDDVQRLLKRLALYESSMIPADATEQVKEGNPSNFGGVFRTGWCQPDPRKEKEEDLEAVDIDIV